MSYKDSVQVNMIVEHIKPILIGHSDYRTASDQCKFSQNGVLYLPRVKEAAMKGHLSC